MTLTIIIPIYNAQDYIGKCINSILEQNYDIEIILVNDGSTDNSQAICEEYASKHSNIRLFNKANGGVSSARNMGLTHATGNWIFFVDADDWLAANSLQQFDHFFHQKEIEYIFFSYITHDNKGQNIKYIRNTSMISCSLKETPINPLWDSFFRRNIIADLKFNEQFKYAEDLDFKIRYLNKVQGKIYQSNVIVYNYNKNPQASVANQFKSENIIQTYNVVNGFLRDNIKREDYMIKSCRNLLGYISSSINYNNFNSQEVKQIKRAFKTCYLHCVYSWHNIMSPRLLLTFIKNIF